MSDDIEIIYEDTHFHTIAMNQSQDQSLVDIKPSTSKRPKLMKRETEPGSPDSPISSNLQGEAVVPFLFPKEDKIIKFVLPSFLLSNKVPDNRTSRDFYLRGSQGLSGWWVFTRDSMALEKNGQKYYHLIMRLDHSIVQDTSQLSICLRQCPEVDLSKFQEFTDYKMTGCNLTIQLLDKHHKKAFLKKLTLKPELSCCFMDYYGKSHHSRGADKDLAAVTDWNFCPVAELRKICQVREKYGKGQVECLSVLVEAELNFTTLTKYDGKVKTSSSSLRSDVVGKRLRKDKTYADVEFLVGQALKDSVLGHTSILAHHSRIWNELFQKEQTDKTRGKKIIRISYVDVTVMNLILDFLYHTQRNISSYEHSVVLNMLTVASKNDIVELTHACVQRLINLKAAEFSIPTALSIFTVGSELKIGELQRRAVEYLRMKKQQMKTTAGMKEIQNFTLQHTNLAASLIIGSFWS